MKTTKIKVKLTEEQAAKFDSYCRELTWLWNQVLKTTLHNYCLDWYKWADKQSTKKNSDWGKFDFEGITRCPVRLGSSPYIGVSCQIAYGGNYFKRDDSVNIPYKNKKGEIVHKKGYKLVKGDKPYTLLELKEHSYPVVPSGKFEGRELKKPQDFDVLAILSELYPDKMNLASDRCSDYVGGLIKKFEASWKAFLDSKNINAKKPKFRKLEENPVRSLINAQKPPRVSELYGTVTVAGLGDLTIDDKSAFRRLNLTESDMRTYSIHKYPSGYYVCVTSAHSQHKLLKPLESKLNAAKKESGVESQQYLDIKRQIQTVDVAIKSANYSQNKGLSVGIDPGVSAVIATDHGALVRPNLSRERISVHIESLQSKLDSLREQNDRAWKLAGNTGKRPESKNEIKLRQKIARVHEKGSNSSKAFNHKLSTRIARTYDHVAWEDTKLLNLMKQTEAKASDEGVGYEHNGASAKRGLNWILRQRCLGDLKAQTKQKVETRGNCFYEPPANHSSQKCHNCGYKGDRPSQHEFICSNPECELHGKVQQADVNAALNHKKNAGLEVASKPKYNTPKLVRTKAVRFRSSKAKASNLKGLVSSVVIV